MRLPFKLSSRYPVRLHHTVVDPKLHSDPAHREHLFHEHAEVSSQELFFDLIFVAIGIELGHFLKADLSAQRLAEVIGIFATSWLTWFHTNIFLTRFQLKRPYSWLILLIMLGTLGHAIHSVDGTTDVNGIRSGFGENDGLIFGSLLMTRLVYLALYVLVCIKIPLARVMLSKYAAAFAITSIMFLVATMAENEAVRIGFWIAALVVELLMYPVALMTPHEYQLTVNTAHLLERNQLWVILILGESIISLASADHTRTAEYYIVVVSAFLITYWLLIYYMKSQHLFDERAEEHALDHSPLLAFIFDTLQLAITTGMLVMAVGFKLAIQYAGKASSGYKRKYAWALTASLGCTLVLMNVSRSCHKMRPLLFLGKPAGRLHILVVQVVISVAVIPLALLVNNHPPSTKYIDNGAYNMTTSAPTTISSKGAYGEGSEPLFGPEKLVPVLAGFMLLLLLVESVVKAVDDEQDEQSLMDMEDFQISKGTQTDLTSFQTAVNDTGHATSRENRGLTLRRRHHDDVEMHWYNFFRQLHRQNHHHGDDEHHRNRAQSPSNHSARHWLRILRHSNAASRDDSTTLDGSHDDGENGTVLRRPSTSLGLSRMADASVDATGRTGRGSVHPPLSPIVEPEGEGNMITSPSLPNVRQSRGFFRRLLRSHSSSNQSLADLEHIAQQRDVSRTPQGTPPRKRETRDAMQGMHGESIQEQPSSSETVGVPAVRTVSAPETGRQTPVTQLNADLHIAAVAAAEGAPPSALATVVAAAMRAPPPPMTRVSLMLGGSTEHLTDSSENGNSPDAGNTPEAVRRNVAIVRAGSEERLASNGDEAATPDGTPTQHRRPATVSGTTPTSALTQARTAVRAQHAERRLQQDTGSHSHDDLARLGSSVASTPSGSPRTRRSKRLLSASRRNQSFLGAPFEEMFYVVEEERSSDGSPEARFGDDDTTPAATQTTADGVFEADGELSSISIV